MRAYASHEAQATFDFLCENQILKMPPTGLTITQDLLTPEALEIMKPYGERIFRHFAAPNRNTERSIWDVLTRLRTFDLQKNAGISAVPILNQSPAPMIGPPSPALSDVLSIGVDYLPLPGPSCSWQDILDARTEMHDQLWAFRRFLTGLAGNAKTEPEIRDEIEWSLNEYKCAIKLHCLRTIIGIRLRARRCDCSFVLTVPVQTLVGKSLPFYLRRNRVHTGAVVFAAGEHGPSDASQLVGHGHDQHVARCSCFERVHP
jgi:hypothetical protein